MELIRENFMAINKDIYQMAQKRKKLMNRRTFLKAAVTITAPTIIPASALGKNGHVAPSNRIVFGCIGLGGQGRHNMRAFINQPDTQVVALCDVDTGEGEFRNSFGHPGSPNGTLPGLQNLKEQYQRRGVDVADKDIALSTDFRELIASPDIDAVTVCTPDHWHGLITLMALESGKDVYCEKPLVNTITEGRAIVETVKRHGRVLQTGSHERSNNSVRYAWELVQNGRIGRLKEIIVNMPNSDDHHNNLRRNTGPKPTMPVPEGLDYNMWLGPAPWAPYTLERVHFWWRFITDYGGGEMTDRGAHIIDLGQYINQTDDTGPIEIIAKGSRVGNGLYDAFIEYEFECRYENGVKLIGTSTGQRGLKLVGTDGWIFIHIHGGRLEASPERILKDKIGPNEIHTEYSSGHHRNFLDAVITRRKPVAHEGIGHRTATICHLLNIAMQRDQKLIWDPVTEQITNDPIANNMVSKQMRMPWSL